METSSEPSFGAEESNLRKYLLRLGAFATFALAGYIVGFGRNDSALELFLKIFSFYFFTGLITFVVMFVANRGKQANDYGAGCLVLALIPELMLAGSGIFIFFTIGVALFLILCGALKLVDLICGTSSLIVVFDSVLRWTKRVTRRFSKGEREVALNEVVQKVVRLRWP
jgi:hypothetical protein